MSKTPKSSFSLQNSYFCFKFFFDQNLDFVLGCLHSLAMSPLDMDDPMCQGIIQSLRVFGAPRGPAGCPSAADVARRSKKSSAMVKAMI